MEQKKTLKMSKVWEKIKLYRWAIVIALFPFCLIFLLRFGVFLTDKFGFTINTEKIDTGTWFAFFGSYAGGVMTLVGVSRTIKAGRQDLYYQQLTAAVQEECYRLSDILSQIDLSVPERCYNEYLSIVSSYEGSVQDLSEIRKEIWENRSKINQVIIRITLETNAVAISSECEKCKEFCELRNLPEKMRANLDSITKSLSEAYTVLDSFVASSIYNLRNDQIVKNMAHAAQEDEEAQRPLRYSYEEIKRQNDERIALTEKREKLAKSIHKLTSEEAKKYDELLTDCRQYIYLKYQYIGNGTVMKRRCF